jgi:geranylgeranyl reductase family protein
MSRSDDWDLIVVGAGPAGSAAAIAALRTRSDARVLVLDRAPMGRDKVCGDGIAPHAVAELDALGVCAVEGREHIGTVRLVAPGGDDVGGESPDAGYVVPRAEFDERLLRAAIDAGAHFEVVRVTTLEQDDAGVTVNGSLRASVVIGADGSNSVVRKLVGESANHGRSLAVAIRGYAPTPAGSRRELLLRWDAQRSGGLCYAWAFPTAHGTDNVGYGLSAGARDHSRSYLERRMRELLPDHDLSGVHLTGHTLPLSVRRPRPMIGRVLLVGDAASLINPFTGEGIYSAIVSGQLAGRAAVSDLRAYPATLDARFGRQHGQATQLYRIIDFPIVLNTVIRAAGRDRRLFERLLDVGLGDAAFSWADFARFGRHAFW